MDNEGRPTTASELTRHLADTLVQNEVVGPMDKIGWQFGTPPTPGMPDNPAPAGNVAPPTAPVAPVAGTTPAPASQPAPTNAPPASEIDWESLRDPKSGLIAGKYTSAQEAMRGAGHVVNMAKEALSARDVLAQKVADLESQLASRQQPAPSPGAAPTSSGRPAVSRADMDASLSKLDSVLSSVAENGGLLDEDAAKSLKDTLREGILAGSKVAAEEALRERESYRSQEDEAWKAVDEYMNRTHPDAAKFTDEIGLFVQSNPLTARIVDALLAKGDRTGATEYAWTEFARDRGTAVANGALAADVEKEQRLAAAGQVRQELVDAARKDAGINGSSASGVHERVSVAPSQNEIEAAAAGMRAYGAMPGNPAAARWRELVIGPHLDSKVFDI